MLSSGSVKGGGDENGLFLSDILSNLTSGASVALAELRAQVPYV